MELKERPIFNEHGNDDVALRKLYGGDSTGIANLNSVKFKWANNLFRIMLNNHWIPEKVSLVDDKVTIKELDKDEMEALKDTLSFLIALDSMQTANLPKMSSYITAPEVSAIYTLQEFQELIHSQSYQYILQELFNPLDREEIYNRWRSNPALLKRNKVIAEKYQAFIDNKTEENFKLALAADFALEGIYFYSGFQFFYLLASRNKLAAVAKVIKYIENDEVTHVSFMNYQIKDVFDLDGDDAEILKKSIMDAVEEEIEWCHTIYGDRILGISPESSESYLKWLGNQRAKLVGLGTLYRGYNKNPYEYLTAQRRENFFETSVTEYSQSTAVDGWDDF